MEMSAFKCRACGETNFIQIEDREIVQVAVPLDLYDEVVRLVARRTRPAKKRMGPLSKVTAEQRQKAMELRATGLTVRQIMVEMGWSLGTTARVLNGVRPGKVVEA